MTVLFKKPLVYFVFSKKKPSFVLYQKPKVMSQKITFAYLVVYQSVTLSSYRKTSIYEDTFAEVYKLAEASCPEGFIIREIRAV